MTKGIALLGSLQIFCAAGFSQNLPFKIHSEIPIQRMNLVVRWKAPKHSLPKTLWVYRVSLTRFSPAVISNLMAVSSFTEKDKKDRRTNEVFFGGLQGDPNLRISFTAGEIEYRTDALRNYGPTNLTKGVPATNQLLQLLTNFLPQLGISPSELARKEDSPKPKVAFVVEETVFFENRTFITNVPLRGIRFNRSVDGAELKGRVGANEIDFGERGQIIEMSLHWPNLERRKLFQTAAPETIIKWENWSRSFDVTSQWGQILYRIRAHKTPLALTNESGVDFAELSLLTNATRFTVTTITPIYTEGPFGQQSGQQEATRYFAPCAELEGVAAFGKTGISVRLRAPILSTDVDRLLKSQ